MPSRSSVLRTFNDVIYQVDRLRREATDDELRRKMRLLRDELEELKQQIQRLDAGDLD
jgi:hypothetical protein